METASRSYRPAAVSDSKNRLLGLNLRHRLLKLARFDCINVNKGLVMISRLGTQHSDSFSQQPLKNESENTTNSDRNQEKKTQKQTSRRMFVQLACGIEIRLVQLLRVSGQ